jgi:hypothetical protein
MGGNEWKTIVGSISPKGVRVISGSLAPTFNTVCLGGKIVSIRLISEETSLFLPKDTGIST